MPGADRPDKAPFWLAVRELETTALLARTPRDALRLYVEFATAAYWMSQEDWENSPPDYEFGGGIDGHYSELVRRAAALLADLSWSPLLHRIGLKKRVSKLRGQATALDSPDVKRNLEHAREIL